MAAAHLFFSTAGMVQNCDIVALAGLAELSRTEMIYRTQDVHVKK